MRVRLQDVNGFTHMPLPAEAANHPALVPGAEVDVIWDAVRAQLVVRAVGASPAEVQFEGNFEQATEDFLARYAQALQELAAL